MERDSRRRGADIPVYTEIAKPPRVRESANEVTVEVCQIPHLPPGQFRPTVVGHLARGIDARRRFRLKVSQYQPI